METNKKKDIIPLNEKGQKHGYVELFHENGELKLKGYFSFDKPEGLFLNYYSNGNIARMINYSDGKKHGIMTTFRNSVNGLIQTIQEFKNDIPHGEYKSYHLNANVLSEGKYYYGERIGIFTFYNMNGLISDTINYGELKEQELNDLINFLSLKEENKDQPKDENGLKNGQHYYFLNGNIKLIVNFHKGKKDGLILYFDDENNQTKKEYYENDELIF